MVESYVSGDGNRGIESEIQIIGGRKIFSAEKHIEYEDERPVYYHLDIYKDATVREWDYRYDEKEPEFEKRVKYIAIFSDDAPEYTASVHYIHAFSYSYGIFDNLKELIKKLKKWPDLSDIFMEELNELERSLDIVEQFPQSTSARVNPTGYMMITEEKIVALNEKILEIANKNGIGEIDNEALMDNLFGDCADNLEGIGSCYWDVFEEMLDNVLSMPDEELLEYIKNSEKREEEIEVEWVNYTIPAMEIKRVSDGTVLRLEPIPPELEGLRKGDKFLIETNEEIASSFDTSLLNAFEEAELSPASTSARIEPKRMRIRNPELEPEIKLITQMYEDHKKEIMRRVKRKNPWGQAETQIDFFEDGRVLMHDHATPSETYYDFEQPFFGFTVTWDPFISYRDLDDIFEEKLKEYLEWKKGQLELEKDFYKHPEQYL